jgi:flagellar motor switch protein FliN/FliY
MPEEETPAKTAWIADACSARLAAALETMTGEKPAVRWEPCAPGDGEAGSGLLWWRQTFSAAPDAPCWIGAPEAAWTAVGRLVLQAAGVAEDDPAGIRSTYLDIVTQSLGELAPALSIHSGKENKALEGRESGPPEGAPPLYSIDLSVNGAGCRLFLGLSQELGTAFGPPASQELPALVPGMREPAAEPPELSRSMDLLLDVDLPVSISFGRAQLPLKDVIKLTTGSIVELNRAVSEPVEVIVNNCVIARGEVVVVEGNFGVRINQVVSRQERLRTLD